jgi:hypothetical protein
VSWEKHEGNITDVLADRESGKVPNFKRWVTVRVQHLRSILNARLSTGINKFLDGVNTSMRWP